MPLSCSTDPLHRSPTDTPLSAQGHRCLYTHLCTQEGALFFLPAIPQMEPALLKMGHDSYSQVLPAAVHQHDHSSHIKCLCKRKQVWKVTSSLYQEGGFSDLLLLLVILGGGDFFLGSWSHCLSRLFYIQFLAHPDILFAFVDCCGRDTNVCWTRPLGWTFADVLVVKSCVLHYLLSISQAIQFSSEFFLWL